MRQIKGLKKAVGDFKRANSEGVYSPRYGNLMFNLRTGEIWTDEFVDLGHNSWKDYNDKAIINLDMRLWDDGIINYTNCAKMITMKKVKEFLESHWDSLAAQYGIEV